MTEKKKPSKPVSPPTQKKLLDIDVDPLEAISDIVFGRAFDVVKPNLSTPAKDENHDDSGTSETPDETGQGDNSPRKRNGAGTEQPAPVRIQFEHIFGKPNPGKSKSGAKSDSTPKASKGEAPGEQESDESGED